MNSHLIRLKNATILKMKLTAIQNGNADEALNLFKLMKVSVSGIRRVTDDLLNHKYRGFLVNTLCRKAIEKANVNLLTINDISGKYAAEIDDARHEDLDNVENLIYEYAQTALKVKSLKYSANINLSFNTSKLIWIVHFV